MEPGSVLWDVGANVGIYSVYASLRKACTVFAFEPSIFNLEFLARNVHSNRGSGQVVIVPLPLASRVGVNNFDLTSTEWGGALATFGEGTDWEGNAMRVSFSYAMLGATGDFCVKELGISAPDYMKIDVDGIEHLVLEGCAELLKTVKGVLIEINEGYDLQRERSKLLLESSGLKLVDRRHSNMFETSGFKQSFNQIWVRV
jgi:FkbM family methyltransferase